MQRSEAMNMEDIPLHELDAIIILCHFFFFAEIWKEDCDKYEPDSRKENVGFDKLLSSFGHFVYDFHWMMQYIHPVASFANLGE